MRWAMGCQDLPSSHAALLSCRPYFPADGLFSRRSACPRNIVTRRTWGRVYVCTAGSPAGLNQHPPDLHIRACANTHATHTHTHARTHGRTDARMHGRTHARARAHTDARTHARTHARARAHTHTVSISSSCYRNVGIKKGRQQRASHGKAARQGVEREALFVQVCARARGQL